ncbi:MAG: hypothetical protein K9H16_02890 [Bacteroidales bacterium]|nr:hypothetical protein [Bacteroidales bacterium]
MPFLKIQTNKEIENADQLILKASTVVAGLLGKPENYVMISLEVNQHMAFGGSNEPMIYCELKSIGLPAGNTKAISKQVMTFLYRETGIEADRIYIEFSDAKRNMWGWNSDTFE